MRIAAGEAGAAVSAVATDDNNTRRSSGSANAEPPPPPMLAILTACACCMNTCECYRFDNRPADSVGAAQQDLTAAKSPWGALDASRVGLLPAARRHVRRPVTPLTGACL